MNVDSSMCASSDPTKTWEQLDWTQCERQVSRLQARIVKATRRGRLNRREYRLRSRGALQRLEPDEGKLSCPVLRGGSDGNVTPLPDSTPPSSVHATPDLLRFAAGFRTPVQCASHHPI